MKTLFFSSTLILFLFSFSSCSKAKSHRWLVADVYVIDKDTGAPISNKGITLYYGVDPILGEVQYEHVELGATDENGYLYVEYRLYRNMSGFQIGTVAAGPYNNYYDKKVSVSRIKKNHVVLKI